MANSIRVETITLEGAQRVLDGALKKADGLGLKACIAVLDRAGELVAFARMDGAVTMTAQVAKDKAFSVVATGLPTHVLWGMMQQAPTAMVAAMMKGDGMQILGGGLPLSSNGQTVGAVGVSGGSAEQDQEIADAGVATIG